MATLEAPYFAQNLDGFGGSAIVYSFFTPEGPGLTLREIGEVYLFLAKMHAAHVLGWIFFRIFSTGVTLCFFK